MILQFCPILKLLCTLHYHSAKKITLLNLRFLLVQLAKILLQSTDNEWTDYRISSLRWISHFRGLHQQGFVHVRTACLSLFKNTFEACWCRSGVGQQQVKYTNLWTVNGPRSVWQNRSWMQSENTWKHTTLACQHKLNYVFFFLFTIVFSWKYSDHKIKYLTGKESVFFLINQYFMYSPIHELANAVSAQMMKVTHSKEHKACTVA